MLAEVMKYSMSAFSKYGVNNINNLVLFQTIIKVHKMAHCMRKREKKNCAYYFLIIRTVVLFVWPNLSLINDSIFLHIINDEFFFDYMNEKHLIILSEKTLWVKVSSSTLSRHKNDIRSLSLAVPIICTLFFVWPNILSNISSILKGWWSELKSGVQKMYMVIVIYRWNVKIRFS